MIQDWPLIYLRSNSLSCACIYWTDTEKSVFKNYGLLQYNFGTRTILIKRNISPVNMNGWPWPAFECHMNSPFQLTSLLQAQGHFPLNFLWLWTVIFGISRSGHVVFQIIQMRSTTLHAFISYKNIYSITAGPISIKFCLTHWWVKGNLV